MTTTLVTATATKEAVESSIGLSLNYYDGGRIVVRNVHEDSLFAGTALKAGFLLVSVNGTEVKGLTTSQVMALFTEAEGEVTVVADDVGLRIASFTKGEANAKVGIGLKVRNGCIIVSSIAEDGLMANTDVKVGHRLLGVNGTSCRGTNTKEAIKLFKELDAITVLAQDIGLISVTVSKESPDTKIGIGLKQINGKMIISNLSEDSLFAGTALRVGLRLLVVGKKDCETLTLRETIALFKDADVGPLTVLADDIGIIAVRVSKESADSKVGIALNEIDGKLLVSGITEDSLFADTDLKVGMHLLCINSTMVKDLPKSDAIEVFKKAEGDIVVFAEKIGIVCVKVTKESPDTKIGIGLKVVNGNIVISSIADGSLFSGTELKVGQKLLTVNKISCSDLDAKAAIELFKDAEGEISVMSEDVGIVGATVMKDTADAKLGIGLKEVKGEVYISSIYEGGLFKNTDLKEDQKLVSINRKSIRGLNKMQAIEMLKEAEGELTVMAMAP